MLDLPPDLNDAEYESIKQIYRNTFNYILDLSGIEDPEEPLNYTELDSPEVCLILWLFSIDSPFYRHVS